MVEGWGLPNNWVIEIQGYYYLLLLQGKQVRKGKERMIDESSCHGCRGGAREDHVWTQIDTRKILLVQLLVAPTPISISILCV